MLPRLAADATLLLHLAFIAFAVGGGLLALRWRWLPLLQLPAAAWGAYVELAGRRCPLTELENHFRVLAGEYGYPHSFIEHYLLPLLYPGGLTGGLQLVLSGLVLAANLAAYGLLLYHRQKRRN